MPKKLVCVVVRHVVETRWFASREQADEVPGIVESLMKLPDESTVIKGEVYDVEAVPTN